MSQLILIVDDDRDNRELLRIILVREGFRIVTATSGEEALAGIALERPDLVLLDVMMPGMSGYEVVTKIKGDPAAKDIPVIMVTALGDESARNRALATGADGLLTKPVGRVELCANVKKMLQR